MRRLLHLLGATAGSRCILWNLASDFHDDAIFVFGNRALLVVQIKPYGRSRVIVLEPKHEIALQRKFFLNVFEGDFTDRPSQDEGVGHCELVLVLWYPIVDHSVSRCSSLSWWLLFLHFFL